MKEDLKWERSRIVSGALEATFQIYSGSDPNGQLIEPTGSIVITKQGPGLWQNTGGSAWTQAGGGGEVNTASNVGTGTGLFKAKSVFDLQFKTLSGSYLGGLTGTLISNTNEVVLEISAVPLSGTIDARFTNLSGTVDGHFNQLSGTIDARFANFSGSGGGVSNGIFEGASVFQSGSQSTLNNTPVTLTYDTVEYDVGSYWSPGANSRLTAPSAGYYFVHASTAWTANSTGFRQLAIRKNAAGNPSGGSVVAITKKLPAATGASYSEVGEVIFLSASEYVEASVTQNSGGALLLTGGGLSYLNFQISKIGNVAGQRTGSYLGDVWNYPNAPSQWDDEFESTVLSASWQQSSPAGSGSFSIGTIDPYASFTSGPMRIDPHGRRKSWLMLQPPQHGAANGLYFMTSGSVPTDMFFLFRASFNTRQNTTPVNNDACIGIALIQSLTGVVDANVVTDVLFAQINEQDGGTVQYEFSKIQGGTPTSITAGFDYFGTVGEIPPYSAMGIQKLGTTYHGWVFSDGGSALYLGSTTWTGSLDAVMIRSINAGAGGTPGNMICGIDFVRFFSSSVYLP